VFVFRSGMRWKPYFLKRRLCLLAMFTVAGMVVFSTMVWRHWGLKSLHFSQEPPWRTPEYKAKWKLIEPFLEPNRSKPQRLKDSHPHVREMALIALARMKAKEAVPHILPLLNDPDKKVRETAKKAL